MSVSALRRQLEYLDRHFRVVSLSHLQAQLRSGQPLDNHTVVLTVDDGRRNCYQYLFPLLKEFQMPATLFVVSSFVRGESWIWTDKVQWLAARSKRPDFLAPNRIDGFFSVLNKLRPEVRDAHIEAVALTMGVRLRDNPPPQFAPCTWSELCEMADSGLVEIGSHTVSHPILSTLGDEESWAELSLSREHLQDGLGGKVSAFCFPNGKPGDFRKSQVEQLKASGYDCAVVTRTGMVTEKADLYDLPRIGICGRIDSLIFSKYLDGADYYQARLEGTLGMRAMAQSSAQ
ncbi:MAG TPA: polysaccharide deacetylase family protein [Terriglobales bacterium]|nr:polysaccharide deacetylase family protein [Terriglobales bacterium]